MITVALGSSLATVVLSKSVPLAEGVLAIGLLIVFQFIAALIIESDICSAVRSSGSGDLETIGAAIGMGTR